MRVGNASPLIHLARVTLLDLLRGGAQDVEVVVPFAVFEEVMRGARHDPSASLLDRLRNHGMRLSDAIIREVLRQAGG